MNEAKFDAARAHKFAQALMDGRPVEKVDQGRAWSKADLYTLSAVCTALILEREDLAKVYDAVMKATKRTAAIPRKDRLA